MRSWPLSVALALCALVALLPSADAGTRTPGSRCPDANLVLGGPDGAAPTPEQVDRARQAALCVINEERRRFGARPFTQDPRLQAAVQARAEDLAANRYIGHESPSTGRTVFDELRLRDYPVPDPVEGNENFSIGAHTARHAALTSFTDHYHCTGVMNPRDTQFAIGAAAGRPISSSDPREGYVYWVYFSTRPEGDRTRRGPRAPAANCPYYRFSRTGRIVRLTREESKRIRLRECPRLESFQGYCSRAERKGRR